MAVFRQDGLHTLIDLSHAETQTLVAKIPVGAAAITAALAAFGVPAFAVAIVGGALAAHAAWEIPLINGADKGDGVTLTCPSYLMPAMIVIPSPRIVPQYQGWSKSANFTLKSSDGDVIECNIAGGGDNKKVVFRLVNQSTSKWDKAFNLFDGQGSHWIRYAKWNKTVEDSLWAAQVANGQQFEFHKPKMFGIWTKVLEIRELEFLKPGAVVTFTWKHD